MRLSDYLSVIDVTGTVRGHWRMSWSVMGCGVVSERTGGGCDDITPDYWELA